MATSKDSKATPVDTAGDIPAFDKQPADSPVEQPATAKGSDMPLSTDHPRLAKDAGDSPARNKARAAYSQAKAEADIAQAEADIHLTPEQKKANELAQKADDLRAKAAESDTKDAEDNRVVATVADAGTLAVVPPELKASDHFAQKFGNDPENPRLAPGVKLDGDKVLLSRRTPDVPGLVYAEVPERMVGDYERAGWNRDVG